MSPMRKNPISFSDGKMSMARSEKGTYLLPWPWEKRDRFFSDRRCQKYHVWGLCQIQKLTSWKAQKSTFWCTLFLKPDTMYPACGPLPGTTLSMVLGTVLHPEATRLEFSSLSKVLRTSSRLTRAHRRTGFEGRWSRLSSAFGVVG